MTCFRVLAVGGLLVFCAALTATAQEEEPSFKAQFQAQLAEWLPGMGAENIPDRRDAQQKLQQLCFELGTPGREAEQVEACQVMAETLDTQLPKPTRIWLLSQLQHLGGQECVDAVAKSLDDADPHIHDAARRALADNPAAEANAKLLAKLGSSNGTFRVGLINALGFRADPASVGSLTGLLRDKDPAAVAAAANALGKIGGPQAAGALKGALSSAPEALKVPIADAYLRCADQLLKQGKTKEAVAIYDELVTDASPRVIRMAAMRGKLNAVGNRGDRE
ncbi:MAG TPA: HEAT repeat domain-containing protein [Thermoguttaceae bacterium]|nr:HEAT repeat domain-containing protein [Thermoguttaceae bacterium]